MSLRHSIVYLDIVFMFLYIYIFLYLKFPGLNDRVTQETRKLYFIF